MGKLIFFMLITLDGFFEGKNHDISWHNVDQDEFNDFAINQLKEANYILFGKTTYEMMAGYWPSEMAIKDDQIVASLMNNTKKIVVSRSLTDAKWENTEIYSNDIEEKIEKLKEGGSNLLLLGSSNLAVSLTNANLIDEYRIMVNPVFLGEGTALLKGLNKKLKLKLLSTKTFKTGNVLLTYTP